VLVRIARELRANIRSSDFLARYGGEEFVILSEEMKLSECEKRFSEVLRRIEAAKFECKSNSGSMVEISITVSCGVAEYALDEPAKDLVRRADDALYEAKRQGKNRVACKKRPLLGAYYEGRRRTPA